MYVRVFNSSYIVVPTFSFGTAPDGEDEELSEITFFAEQILNSNTNTKMKQKTSLANEGVSPTRREMNLIVSYLELRYI